MGKSVGYKQRAYFENPKVEGWLWCERCGNGWVHTVLIHPSSPHWERGAMEDLLSEAWREGWRFRLAEDGWPVDIRCPSCRLEEEKLAAWEALRREIERTREAIERLIQKVEGKNG